MAISTAHAAMRAEALHEEPREADVGRNSEAYCADENHPLL